MHMQSSKDLQISSTAGIAIAFTAGVPRYVPESLRAPAIMAGCLPVLAADPESAPVSVPGANAEHREGLIKGAIMELIAKNDDTKFKNDGTPRVDAVRTLAGDSDITAEEVAAAFVLISASAE